MLQIAAELSGGCTNDYAKGRRAINLPKRGMLMNILSRFNSRSLWKRLVVITVVFEISSTCECAYALAPGEAVVRDQFHPGNNSGLATVRSDAQVAQTFSVGISGRLERVEVYVNDNGNSSDLLWDIRSTTGGVPNAANGSTLASGSVLGSAIPIFPELPPTLLELGSFNINVHAGDVLAITLRTATTSGLSWRVDGLVSPSVYRRSNSTSAWSLDTFWGTQVMGYATYVSIPEPSTAALLLINCVLGLGFRRRR